MEEDEFRHTGIWPFSILERATDQKGEAQSVKVFDQVALAFDAGAKLIDAGWVGLELMPTKFLWDVIDADKDQVDALVFGWVSSHQCEIAEIFQTRVISYTAGDLEKRAMEEALTSYRASHFLATVRTLMPEVERFGRQVVLNDNTMPRNMKEAVEAIRDYLGNFPVSHFSPIESVTIYKIIAEDLFAKCFTQADAQQLGAGLNRHAELHGLTTYGDLRGATNMLCVQDFMLHAVTAAHESQAEKTES